MSQPRDDVPWQTDADDLHDGLEDQEDEVVERRVGIVGFLEDDEWRCGRHGERWCLDVGEAKGRWHSWRSDGLWFRKVEVERTPRKVSETESRSGAGLLVEFCLTAALWDVISVLAVEPRPRRSERVVASQAWGGSWVLQVASTACESGCPGQCVGGDVTFEV